MSCLRVLVADDNPAMLQAVVDMLSEEFDVVGAMTGGTSVLQKYPSLRPDVIVLDISLGDMTGFDLVRQLHELGCTAKVVFLTVHQGQDFVRAAAGMGVSGYVYKSQTEALREVIVAVSEGKRWFPLDFEDQ